MLLKIKHLIKYFAFMIYLTLVSSRKLPSLKDDVLQINLGYKSIIQEQVPALATVILKCSYDKPNWFKNNLIFLSDIKQSKTIRFNNIQMIDSGIYSCQSGNGEFSNLTLKVNLAKNAESSTNLTNNSTEPNFEIKLIDTNNKMVEPVNPSTEAKPYFLKTELQLKTVRKLAGNSFKFNCSVGKYLKPKTTWIKDGRLLKPRKDLVFSQNGTLTIDNLCAEDSGSYTCLICGTIDCINSSINLEVTTIQNKTLNDFHHQNDFKNNIESFSQLSEDIEVDDNEDYSERDKLTNASNEIENKDNERLTSEETKNDGAPRFTKPDSLIKLIAKPSGNMVKFKCAADGNPTPNITWTKDGAPISRSMGQVTYRKWGIILEDLVPKDSGLYTCILCNIYGCIDFTAKLDVKDRVNHKPIIKKVPENQTSYIGATVVFKCPVLSDLHLHIQWLFSDCEDCIDKNIILKTDPDNPEELKLENITYENEGWYTCGAANSLGVSTAKAYLRVVDEMPKSPILAPINSNPVITIAIVVISISFIIITLGIMYVQFRKIKHEKLMKHRAMETVHQWTKKIIILKPALDTTNPDHVQIPIVKIEKQRTTMVQTASNDLGSFNEYEFPLDSNWEFPRCQLALGPTLGEGAFGRVVMAEAHGLIKNATSLIVAVKMVKEGHTDSEMASLVQEMEVMKMIGKHINIINLLGCCSQDGPLYVIVEYAPHGNLKDFLKKHRPASEYEVGMPSAIERKQILQRELISFAFQIARGMEYLASRRCIHRDLAARNVLVSDDYVVKIADFGLARDIQESEYYRKNTNGRLPIKWMAPESLRDKFYDTQSDVWSYGVLLWEIMTYGEQPYPHIYSSEHLFEFLREGSRMEKPSHCSLNIYMLMRQCWNWNPPERPNFTEIVENLDKILSATANEEYLDLDVPLLKTPPSSDDDESDTETLQEHVLLKYSH